MTSILLVSPKHFENSPRGVRMRSIVKSIDIKDITVIAYESTKNCESNVISISKSPFIHYIERSNNNIKGRLFKFIHKVVRYISVKLLFPDYHSIDVSKFIYAIRKELKNNDYSHVIFVSSPFMSLLILKLIKLNSDEKVLLDIGDPFSFNSAYKYNKLYTWLRYKFEVSVLRKLDSLIVTNVATQDEYRRMHRTLNINIVPQGSDSDYQPSTGVRPRREIMTFIYAGAFYKGIREPYALLKASGRLAGMIELNLYGPSFDFPIEESNVSINDSVSAEIIYNLYQESDVLVFVDNISKYQTSGKIYELLAAKKPIIFIYSDEESPTLLMIRSLSLDYVFTCNNEENSIESTIDKILSSDLESLNYNYESAENSWKSRAKSYKSIIESI